MSASDAELPFHELGQPRYLHAAIRYDGEGYGSLLVQGIPWEADADFGKFIDDLGEFIVAYLRGMGFRQVSGGDMPMN